MGSWEVQVLEAPSAQITAMAGAHRAPPAGSVRSLASSAGTRPNNGSRMRRESHVRFCESVGVKLPHATHLGFAGAGGDDIADALAEHRSRQRRDMGDGT